MTQTSHRWFARLSLSLLALWVGGCGGGGGGGLFGVDLSDDPDALQAGRTAGNVSAGLEVILTGAGLLTEVPLGMLPAEAVQVASDGLNELFESCLTATPITEEGTGLSVSFAQGGCGIPTTNIQLQGGFSFQTTATEETSQWGASFTSFEVAGVAIDGAVDIEIQQGESLDYTIDELSVNYSGEPIMIDSQGTVNTNAGHTEIVFSGQGAVTYGGNTYSVEITNLNRHLTTDCYPETGTLRVGVTTAGGQSIMASVSFDDSGLGLDSDDSGVVQVSVNGKDHNVQLPARNCSGF